MIRADKIQKLLSSRYVKIFPDCFIYPISYAPIIMMRLITILKGPIKLYKEYEELFRSYELLNTRRISSQSFNRNILERSMKEKEWFRETIWIPFEDILMPVPVDYDTWLRRLYGPNYMIPQKAPSFHGEYLVLDPQKSYKYYLPILKKTRWKKRLQKIFYKMHISENVLNMLWIDLDPNQ